MANPTPRPAPQPAVSPPLRPNGIEARRERQRDEARRAILDASRDLVAESEDGDFSIRALADRSGYSPPTIYNHFGDKPGLLAAVLEDGLRALADELSAAAASSEDPLARLRAALLTFDRHANEQPGFSHLWQTVGRESPPPSLESVRAHVDEPITALLAAGRLGGFDREQVGQILWSLLHGLVAVRRTEPDHPWAPQLTELAVDTLLRGLTGEGDAPPAGGAR